jgi:hypothetical protein
MRHLIMVLVIGGALAACGLKLSPEQQAERNAIRASTAAALESATDTDVNGKTFRVAVLDDLSYALVDQVGEPSPYKVEDIEAAARNVTKCPVEFNAGVLAFLTGDMATADLADLRTKITGNFSGWRVNLQC